MRELSREETIQHRLASAHADQALRSGQKMTDEERRVLTEGAAWERSMHRIFKGICTRKQRRDALQRAVER
jgi:hypothetical protein